MNYELFNHIVRAIIKFANLHKNTALIICFPLYRLIFLLCNTK